MSTNIKNRNLVVAETFDEFAEKAALTDFNVEDIVGYITSLSRSIYVINIESIWGFLGFTWDYLESSEFPVVYETLEQVDEDGNIIDYDGKSAEWKLKHSTKKGYGHFNRTTVPFTIIPRIPDGERITRLQNTFSDISSNKITIQKSNWESLKRVENIVTNGKEITIDLTGAKLDYFSPWHYTTGGGTLYVIGDFTNTNCRFDSGGVLLVDDNNKGLNIDLSNVTDTVNPLNVRYTGSDAFVDSNYFIGLEDNKLYGNTYVRSLTNKLVLHAMPSKDYEATYNYGFKIPQRKLIMSEDYPAVPPINEPDIELTIDTSVCKNINMAYILDFILYNASGRIPGDNSVYCGIGYHKLLPIKYIGDVYAIDMYNPNCSIYEDFPELDDDVVTKLVNSKSGQFMPYVTFYNYPECSYTLDLSNYDYYSIYDGYLGYSGKATELNTLSYYSSGVLRTVYLYENGFPTLTGMDHVFEEFTLPRCTSYYRGANNLCQFFVLPSIKSKIIHANRGYIKRGTKIECSKLYTDFAVQNGWFIIEDMSTPSFKIFPTDDKMEFNAEVYKGQNSGTDINYIEFETLDKAILRNSKISTVHSGSLKGASGTVANFIQPYILSRQSDASSAEPTNYLYLDNLIWHNGEVLFNPSFIFIYRSHIKFRDDARLSGNPFTDEVIANIIDNGLEPLINSDDYGKFWVRVPRSFVNNYTGGETALRNRVETICHYSLTINESR